MEKKISSDINKKIAKVSANYLKIQIIETQNKIAEKIEEGIVSDLIDYEDFMKLFKQKRSNIYCIEGFDDEKRIELLKEQEEFVEKYETGIIISDKNIADLIRLLKKSIFNCGLGELNFLANENGFIREVFIQVVKMNSLEKNEIFKKEELKEINDWLSFFSASEDIGFEKDSKFTFYYDYYDKFIINDNGSKPLFEMKI